MTNVLLKVTFPKTTEYYTSPDVVTGLIRLSNRDYTEVIDLGVVDIESDSHKVEEVRLYPGNKRR